MGDMPRIAPDGAPGILPNQNASTKPRQILAPAERKKCTMCMAPASAGNCQQKSG